MIRAAGMTSYTSARRGGHSRHERGGITVGGAYPSNYKEKFNFLKRDVAGADILVAYPEWQAMAPSPLNFCIELTNADKMNTNPLLHLHFPM